MMYFQKVIKILSVLILLFFSCNLFSQETKIIITQWVTVDTVNVELADTGWHVFNISYPDTYTKRFHRVNHKGVVQTQDVIIRKTKKPVLIPKILHQ